MIQAAMICLALLVATFSFSQTARADFLSCAISGANIGDCLEQEGEDQTSFTNFQGGLQAPSSEGYSPGLVQAESGREFVVNVINFVAGFLGLIAMGIIIYGGFLYVTAAGQEEQASKGKKSVTYAVIGIILILGSYAIVNTVLLAPSGTDNQGLSGSAPGQSGGTSAQQQAQRRALFNLAAREVNAAATQFAAAYQNYVSLNLDIEELIRVPQPNTASNLISTLRQKLQILQRIQQQAGQFSQMNEAVRLAIVSLESYLNDQQALINTAEPNAPWDWDPGSFNAFVDVVNSQASPTSLRAANETDFALAVVTVNENMSNLRTRIEGAVDLVQLNDVRVAFDDLTQELNSLASGSTGAAEATLNYAPANNDVLRVLQSMATLSETVTDILFIHTVITADRTEGNAPFIVQLDGLQSLDPLNRTINASAYKWDFGDAGNKPSDLFGLNENTGPSVVHVFTEPGTYVVKLTVEAPPQSDPSQPPVADGVAYQRITVRPPVTKISLTANINQEQYALRQYDPNTGNLLIDRGVLKVTPSEAAAGIEFDASTTDATRIQSVRWDFGDNTPEVFGSGASIELSQTHQFTETGSYTVVLEVTDIQGNVDRKIVTVVVDTPIARMNISPGNNLFVNQQFTLDASSSASEGGQIESFRWVPSSEAGLELDGSLDFETITARYIEPGLNQIQLQVVDNLGGEDSASVNIVVESQAPVAQFKQETPKANQPSTVTFDGSLSYDPDGEGALEYQWEVDGQESGQAFEFIDGTTTTSEKPKIKFKELGTYTVALTAIDPNGFGTGIAQEGEIFEQEIVINNILDIAWDPSDSPSAKLEFDEETGQAGADIDFTIISENAIAYEIDWGDEEIESGEMTNRETVSHTYAEAGTFPVTVSVFDQEDNENSISRKVFISSDDTPISVIGLSVNGEQVFDTTEVVEISRTDSVTFDAGDSLNVDGTGRRLNYSWDFGNGERSTQQTSNQTFRELGTYEVSLRVTNSQDPTQISPVDRVTLEVVGEPPVLRSITAVPTTTDITTPVTVQVNAIGAEDPDGRISRYRWWYYDPNNDNDELGIQVTSAPSASITIGTRGEEGQEKTYKFAVEMTDEENNSISSRELISEDRTATLTVVNGPNEAPTASFNVDRTSILVGETVNFSSSSRDPDGQITRYLWDFEGDGFANNSESLGSNVSHTFTEAAPDGIRVRLKVIDNNESEATSDPVTIFVDAIAQDPVAAFTSEQTGETRTVTFTNNSEADTAAGATIESYVWDFDINTDSNGDGIKDNDRDALEESPTHEYPEFGIYRARLTVEDSEGSTSQVTNFVNVKSPMATTSSTGGTTSLTTGTSILDARLETDPPRNLADNKIHIPGTGGNVVLDYSASVGDIKRYIIDKNIYFDTDGNGLNYDDEDFVATQPGTWTTDFQEEWGQIRLRLTVEGTDGRTDTVERDVVFDSGPTGNASLSANVLALNDVTLPAILVSGVGFGIILLNNRSNKKK